MQFPFFHFEINSGITSTGVQGAVLEWLERNSNIKLQHFYNSDTRTALFIVKIDPKINVSNIDCV